MLEAFDVKYMPQTAEELGNLEEGVNPKKAVRVETVVVHRTWQLFVDGAANQKRSGIGIVMISPSGITLEKSLRLSFLAINNEAEYEALLVGLIVVQKLGGKTLKAYCDSRLIV